MACARSKLAPNGPQSLWQSLKYAWHTQYIYLAGVYFRGSACVLPEAARHGPLSSCHAELQSYPDLRPACPPMPLHVCCHLSISFPCVRRPVPGQRRLCAIVSCVCEGGAFCHISMSVRATLCTLAAQLCVNSAQWTNSQHLSCVDLRIGGAFVAIAPTFTFPGDLRDVHAAEPYCTPRRTPEWLSRCWHQGAAAGALLLSGHVFDIRFSSAAHARHAAVRAGQSLTAHASTTVDAASTVPGDDIAIAEPAQQQEEDATAGQANAREALFNCVNILLGCGVLSIPYALEEGGWAAFGVLALMWVSTNYTGMLPQLLLESQLPPPWCIPPWLCVRHVTPTPAHAQAPSSSELGVCLQVHQQMLCET